jgi:hypothetical protein
MCQFDWPFAKKKFKLQRLPKIEDSMESWGAFPFGPPIKVRRWAFQMVENSITS